MKTKYGNAIIRSDGYYIISSTKEGNHNKYLHRLIYEEFWGIKLPKQIHIHHKDKNPANNCILNLEAIPSSEHSKKHHTGKITHEETKLKISNSLKGHDVSEETKQKLSDYYTGREISSEIRHKMSRTRNTTGIKNVSINICDRCKQGFTYRYQYYDGKKRKFITSVDLDKLKEKVLAKGLDWIVFDKEDSDGIRD